MTATATDLAGFLLARTAEDEERAEAANGGRIAAQLYTSKNATADDIRFTEAWSPARVLAECDAKRRIVEQCAAHIEDGVTSGAMLGERVLGLLALPYADHPDYDPSWQPGRALTG